LPALRHRFRLVLLPACIVALMAVAGCSSSSDNSDTEEGGQSQGTAADGNATGAVAIAVDSRGRKSIDGIPLEALEQAVYYPDPLAVNAQTGNVSPSPVTPQPGQTTNETPSETPTEEPAPQEPPKAAAVDWGKIIPMEILDAEIKSIRNFLTPTLQTVGSYNRDYIQIPTYAMTMAALAEIAMQHPGDALWKDKAAALRDLSYNLSNAAEGPGRKSFDPATVQFEKILQIFNGTTPDLDEQPDPEATFSDRVDRGPIMKRIDLAQKWLSSNTPAASSLKDNKEKALNEAVILGALIKVSGDKSYLYSDEADYQKHVADVMAGVEKMRDSIATENYDGFKEGLGVVSRKCAECHTQYKD